MEVFHVFYTNFDREYMKIKRLKGEKYSSNGEETANFSF